MMRYTVRVKPGAKIAAVREISEAEYEIDVVARPERGKATDQARRALAAALHVAPSRLSLIIGFASRSKVFELR
jgi:hypothetical protein